MTNTYSENARIEIKIKEELRLIRCCLERLLNHFDRELFVDYEMEKFSTIKK